MHDLVTDLRGNMQALGSVRVDLVNPTPDMINFRTMAIIMARVPRFAGHTEGGVYSDAQHSVEGAYAILRDTGRRDWAAAFLLHDGHESWIGDDATPKTEALCMIAASIRPGAEHDVKAAFRELKRRLDEVIYQAAGFDWPLDSETRDVVKVYDLRMCRTEREARLAPKCFVWADEIENAEPVVGCALGEWSEDWAHAQFLNALREFLPNTLL